MVNTGDLVFAKVRGWCPWPGKVMCQVSPSHYKIFFYGDNKEGFVKIGNIWSARDNLEQFTKKYRNRKGYSGALEKMKNKPNSFAASEFDLCPHKCITCDPKKMEDGAKSTFQMEENIVVNVDQCMAQIQSKKLQIIVKKIASPVQEEDDYSTEREKELSLEHDEDSSESENKEREAEGREKVPPPKGKSSIEKSAKVIPILLSMSMELRVEAREKSRGKEERKRKEKKQEEERKKNVEKIREEAEKRLEEEEKRQKEEEEKKRRKEEKRQEEEKKRQEKKKREEEEKIQKEKKREEEEEKRREEEEKRREEEEKRLEEEKRQEEEKRREEEERQHEEDYCQVLFEMPKEKKRKRTSGQIVDYNLTDSDEASDCPVIISAPSPKAAKLIPLCAPGELPGQASEIQNEMEPSSHWKNRLEQILKDAGDLQERAYGCYRIDISNTENGNEHFFLELWPSTRRVLRVEDCPDRPVDVRVSLSSGDLTGVLDGSVQPLTAYFGGRISVSGDFSKLLAFSQLTNKTTSVAC